MSNGWGGRINYTYSRLKDNQFGESNFFSTTTPAEMQNAYDLDAEYSIGLLDVPHKMVVLADRRAAVRRRQEVG